jgi:hypothetical protein
MMERRPSNTTTSSACIRKPYHLATVFLLGLMVGVAGCGAPHGDVSGTVTCNGRRVVYGTVLLVAADGIQRSGNINPDGRYRIRDVPVGPAKFAVVSPDPELLYRSVVQAQRDPQAAANIETPAVDRSRWFALSRTYQDPASSGIAYTIARGPNTFDIRLDRTAEADRLSRPSPK